MMALPRTPMYSDADADKATKEAEDVVDASQLPPG